MSNLPLHPLIVHIPLALAVLLPLVATGVLLAWYKDWLPGRTWWVVLALQAMLVIGGFAALRSGEHDEERVERVIASEAVLEEHESAAKLFELGAFVVLGLMVVPLVTRRPGIKRTAALVATAGTLGVLGLGLNVGHAGGRLVYEQGAANAYLKAPAPGSVTSPAPVLAESGDDDD